MGWMRLAFNIVKNMLAAFFLALGVLTVSKVVAPTFIETSVMYFALSWFCFSAQMTDNRKL